MGTSISYVWLSQHELPHFKLMILRSVLAAVFVTAAIAVASALNSRWAGIMVGFPMTMLAK